MSQPLVSVIIPAYNASRYIAETLDSVLRQTHPRREVILVDDGSTDDTRERIEPYRASIRYIWQENAGGGAARNAGLRVAAGDYIAFLDHDDVWLPEKLAVQLTVSARHPESGLIACDGVQFDGDRILSPHLIGEAAAERLARSPSGEITGRFYREWLQAYPISCPAQTLIPRHVAERIGPQRTGWHETREWDYSLRIALAYPITLHRDSLVRWRYHPTSVSGPQDRRVFTWALRKIPTLRRHRALCAPEDRPLVTAVRRQLARDTARGLYYFGRQHDLSYARGALVRLARRAPDEPSVLAYLAAAWLPEPLAHAIGRNLRRLAPGRRRG